MKNTYIDPIAAACLFHADKVLGEGLWKGEVRHASFLSEMDRHRRKLNSLPEDTVEAIGSVDVNAVNAFLRDRGYAIELDPLPHRSIYLAAVMDLLVEWENPGSRSQIYIDRDVGAVPSVQLSEGSYAVAKNVLRPSTSGPVSVYMVESLNLAQGMDDVSRAIAEAKWSGHGEYAEFPMVELDRVADLSHLVGLSKADAVVAQVVAQAKLRINEFGAHAEAAVAMGMSRGEPPFHFKIAGPFTVVFATADGIVAAFQVGNEDLRSPSATTTKPTDHRYLNDW